MQAVSVGPTSDEERVAGFLPSPLFTENAGTLIRPREQPVVLRHDIPHRLQDLLLLDM